MRSSSDDPDPKPKASNKKGKKESLTGPNATKKQNRTKSDQESNKKLKDKKGNVIEEEKLIELSSSSSTRSQNLVVKPIESESQSK